MTPIDFLVYDGDSSPNTAIYKIAEAMKKPIKILSECGEHKVLSYYFDGCQFCLDISDVVENDA